MSEIIRLTTNGVVRRNRLAILPNAVIHKETVAKMEVGELPDITPMEAPVEKPALLAAPTGKQEFSLADLIVLNELIDEVYKRGYGDGVLRAITQDHKRPDIVRGYKKELATIVGHVMGLVRKYAETVPF